MFRRFGQKNEAVKEETMKEIVDVTIIGSGVVGLAVASEVASKKRRVYVLEKNDTFGQETSSRNSQVVHAGLYYPPGSLKSKTCVEGNRILYAICERNRIAFKKLTKVVVATNELEVEKLESLRKNGLDNGVKGLCLLSRQEIKKLEPNVKARAALFVPSTGIIDGHGLMKYFLQKAKGKKAQVVFRSKVTGITKANTGYWVEVQDAKENFNFLTRVLINCAGLEADKVAAMLGIDIAKAGYRLHYCKGEYFSVSGGKSGLVKRLVYPVPLPELMGVGIHVTLDLDGRIRLGPGVEYVKEIDYKVEEKKKPFFYASVKKFLPDLTLEDLEPEMAGIRPKLQGSGEKQKDFVIHHEMDKKLPGLINLVGIESPGLTASPAIAKMVGNMVNEIL